MNKSSDGTKRTEPELVHAVSMPVCAVEHVQQPGFSGTRMLQNNAPERNDGSTAEVASRTLAIAMILITFFPVEHMP